MQRLLIYFTVLYFVNLLNIGLSQEELLILNSVFPLIVTGVEFYSLYKKYRSDAFFNVTFLCSLFLFAFSFGLTNFIYLGDGTQWVGFDLKVYIGTNYLPIVNDTLFWVNSGLLMMWAGSRFVEYRPSVYRLTLEKTKVASFLSKQLSINWLLVHAMLIVSFFSKLYLIKLGSFGFTSDVENITENAAITSWINIGSDLSHLVLVVYLINYFKTREKFSMLAVVFLYELAFGLISGFKFQVMFPFVALLLIGFIVRRKIKLVHLIATAVSVVFAYSVVEPFRQTFLDLKAISNKQVSIEDIVAIYDASTDKNYEIEDAGLPVLDMFLSRNNLTGVAAKAFQHQKDTQEELRQLNYPIRLSLLPLMAYLPRAFWVDKPINNMGMVFNQEVLGASYQNITSVSPSLFGYLVLGLNARWVILPFLFLLGVLQGIVNKVFRFKTMQALLLYLIVFGQVVQVNEMTTLFVFFLRDMPIAILLLTLIFRKPAIPQYANS